MERHCCRQGALRVFKLILGVVVVTIAIVGVVLLVPLVPFFGELPGDEHLYVWARS